MFKYIDLMIYLILFYLYNIACLFIYILKLILFMSMFILQRIRTVLIGGHVISRLDNALVSMDSVTLIVILIFMDPNLSFQVHKLIY